MQLLENTASTIGKSWSGRVGGLALVFIVYINGKCRMRCSPVHNDIPAVRKASMEAGPTAL